MSYDALWSTFCTLHRDFWYDTYETVLRKGREVEEEILKELFRRGGRIDYGTRARPGKNSDFRRTIATALGVTKDELLLTLGDLNPHIVESWKNGQRPAGAW